ncbi:MAG: DUF2284 domain-containing protein [Synergistaceae bacterium]|nr:DUF2284 domain-containing protein [Synergistaceae bacterium]
MNIKYTASVITGRCSMQEFIKDYVNVEYFQGFCTACCYYGKNWSCTPHDFDVLGFLKSYDDIRLIGVKIKIDRRTTRGLKCKDFQVPPEVTAIVDIEKAKLTKTLLKEERANPGSTYLFAGQCEICPVCARVDGLPCRHPEKMRYSLESVGGDVTKIAKEILGLDILWMKDNKIPEYLTLICALLLKNQGE